MYLGEPENVVNEEQHILTFSISEVLSNRQSCKTIQSRTAMMLLNKWQLDYSC